VRNPGSSSPKPVELCGPFDIVEIANTSHNQAGNITNINWHGPLVNHFHLDLAF